MAEGFSSAGSRIRKLRRMKRLTQEELGELAGLHPSYVGQVERGQRTPSVKTLEAMARALGIDASFLLRTTDGPDSPVEDLLALVAVASPQQVQLITRIAETVLSSGYQVGRDRRNTQDEEPPTFPKPSK
ncbi:MAG: helix-turn-helix domain-containing protein [Bacillota bacterium]